MKTEFGEWKSSETELPEEGKRVLVATAINRKVRYLGKDPKKRKWYPGGIPIERTLWAYIPDNPFDITAT